MEKTLTVGVPKEILESETRVALTPESVKNLIKKGFNILVENDAGKKSYFTNEDYIDAGAKIISANQLNEADIIVKIQPPNIHNITNHEIDTYKNEAYVFCLQDINNNKNNINLYNQKKITSFALEWIPRTTLAQSMDILSSMATLSGYKAVLIAANHLEKIFPMLMTAASTIMPAKVLIIGAGVAGLQAIATAKRLGAMVEAFDVRPIAKEQVMSLGAKFIDIGNNNTDAQDKQGYAKASSQEEIEHQKRVLAKHLSTSDICITTAQVFGKKAPILISKDMITNMKPGSVIVDLAAEQGGNTELTKENETVIYNGVTLIGSTNLPALMPIDGSKMFSKNIEHLLVHIFPGIKENKLELKENDEITQRTLLTKNGMEIPKEF